MKKVILILILFLTCYFIYNKTIDEKIYYLTIGDFLSKGVNSDGTLTYGYGEYIKDYLQDKKQLNEYNKTFTDSSYRIIDIIKIIEYNEKKEDQSLNYLIKKADIITISLGMNELYSKIENNTNSIYTYIDEMINNYNKIFEYIDLFHSKKVFVLGYYNVFEKDNDIFEYANYKLKDICNKYNFMFLDLSKLFNNNPLYFDKKATFIPNYLGYEKISQIIIEIIKNN